MPADVAIIGAGLGGLSAAIHLRLAGHAVTMFEANPHVGGRANVIERDGFTWDTGPSLLNYPWVFEELFAAAGRCMADYVSLTQVDPTVQFRWPDGTVFSLSSDLSRLLGEFDRLEPGSRPATLAFLRDASAKYRAAFDKLVTHNDRNPLRWLLRLSPAEMLGSAVWRSLDAELSRFFKNRYIREALGSYAMYLGGSPYELPGLFTILAYGELAYGLWLPKGGVYGLVRGVERLARELGVVIHTGCRVDRIVTAGGVVRGVQIDGALRPFPLVVSNVDVPTTSSQLLGRAESKPPRMTPGVLTFYWGLRHRLENISHHTIFLPDDYRGAFEQLSRGGAIPTALPFYVSIASETDPDLAPPGCSTLFVLVPTPVLSAMGATDWPGVTRGVKEKVLQRMRQEGVAIEADDIVAEEVWTPEDWRTRFGLHDGSAFGAAHTLFQMGPWRANNRDHAAQGLYYTGAGTTPGTGMPMVVLGGRMTADRMAADVR